MIERILQKMVYLLYVAIYNVQTLLSDDNILELENKFGKY